MPSAIGIPVLNVLKIITPKDITKLSKQVKGVEKVQLTKILTEEMHLRRKIASSILKKKEEKESSDSEGVSLKEDNDSDSKIEEKISQMQSSMPLAESLHAGAAAKEKEEQKANEEIAGFKRNNEEKISKSDKKKIKESKWGSIFEEEEIDEEELKRLENMPSSSEFFLQEKQKGSDVEKDAKKAEILKLYKQSATLDIQKEEKEGDLSKTGQTGILLNKKRY